LPLCCLFPPLAAWWCFRLIFHRVRHLEMPWFQDGYTLSAFLVCLPLPRYDMMVGMCVSSVAHKMDSFLLLFLGDL
jgi:hypothetical protein